MRRSRGYVRRGVSNNTTSARKNSSSRCAADAPRHRACLCLCNTCLVFVCVTRVAGGLGLVFVCVTKTHGVPR